MIAKSINARHSHCWRGPGETEENQITVLFQNTGKDGWFEMPGSPQCNLAPLLIKFRKQPRTRPASRLLPKWPKYALTLRPSELWYLELQTHLPEMKQKVTPSYSYPLLSSSENQSLPTRTWAAVSPSHSNYFMRWTARARKSQVARDPAEPRKGRMYQVWDIGQSHDHQQAAGHW